MKRQHVLTSIAALFLLTVAVGLTQAQGPGTVHLTPDAMASASISFGSGNVVGDAGFGTGVWALAAGDLDNDGDPDLVSGDIGNSVRAWQNDGTPFSGGWISNTAGTTGGDFYALAVGDLDNDGRLDIASGSSSAAAFEILAWQNDGTPFSGGWISNNVGTPAASVYALAMADLDNDGDPDLVSGDTLDRVRVWQNDSTPFAGTWVSNTAGTTPGAGDVRALAVGDLDNDGDLDIVSGDSASQVVAWQNDGTPFSGSWVSQTVFTAADDIYSLALVDLDGNGRLDIVAGCGSGEDYELTAWENDGTPFSGVWTQHDISAPEASVYAIAAADLDVDGDPDVVSGSAAHATQAEVRTWENNGSPFADTWSSSNVGETGGGYVRALVTADLDIDGDPDLVGAAINIIMAWPNTRAPAALGNWTEGTQPAPTNDTLSVAVADFDHDGKSDIAAGTTANGVHVWRGDGGYHWTHIAASLPITGMWNDVAWGQINNADELDLAAASEGNGLRAWVLTQGGASRDDISTGLPITGSYRDLALAHFNFDGRLDLAACGKDVGVRIWQGTGGSGPPWWVHQVTLSDTLDFCDMAVGHVDHNGDLDIVAANCGDNRGIPVWLGSASFGFSAASPVTTSGQYQAVALGDINNDGNADVVAAPQNGGVRIWLGNGGATWTHTTTLSPTLLFVSLDLGDFDNDGYLDILAGLSDGGVHVWKGDDGKTWTDASTNLSTDKSYPGVAFGRIDGDAALDIAGAQSGGSGVRVWTAIEPPPGGWANFVPDASAWSRSQQVTCTVRLADAGSGLDVSTAQYHFSRDGGGSWIGDWLTATVSGADGTTAPQVMTATNVLFNHDSSNQNVIMFRIRDMAGLTGTSPMYNVQIDTTSPTNPSDLTSPSHTAGAWSDDNSIRFTWTNLGYDAASGLWGYSWILSRTADMRPDETVDQGIGPGDETLWAIPDGDWYLHFMTRDRAGNWSAPAHLGPYRIDMGNPTTPTFGSSSHTVGGWSTDNTIYVSYNASDAGGISGYSYEWHQNTIRYPDTVTDTASNSRTSSALADGQWYFHVRAVDHAGNAGGTAHFGPFGVDATDPTSCWINAPALSAETCLVEWHYLDASSGVAGYDVQVRDDTYSGDWTGWLTNTASTSAVYTGAWHLGTYSFRVRARDQAGNLSGYDCSDQTTMEDLDGDGYHLEVTQGIQNAYNDVPLIAGKTTYVRFYVRSAWSDVTNVSARLYGRRGSTDLGSITPVNGRITVRAGGRDRSTLDGSFYFRLPAEWSSGTISLTAVVNPSHTIPEDDYTNNERPEIVTFEDGGGFCIVFVPVHLHPATYYIDDHEDSFWDIVTLMNRMLPVRDNGIAIYDDRTMYPSSHGVGWEYGLPSDFDRVISDLWWYAFWTHDPCHDTHYWGMVDPRHLSGRWGMAYYPPLSEGAGVMDDNAITPSWEYPLGGLVLAHELGHNFNRYHIDCGGPENPHYDYPYSPCQIAPDESDGYYGFVAPILGGAPEIITPTEAAPLMSYGSPQWIDDWTYRRLHDRITSSAQAQVAPTALSPAWAQATEYLAVSGIISPAGHTAELQAFYRTSTPKSSLVARSFQQEVSGGPYSLVLQDASGIPIYTHTFTTTAISPYGSTPLTELFAEVFPYDTQTARIALKQESTELASRLVSTHTPTVTLLSPNGSEVITDHLTISWTASDDDGDALRYTVQYSPDDGATWRVIVVNWTVTSFDVNANDLATLPGSSQARIRVTATDGVNTASDQSNATFTLARKSPRAHIIEPEAGSQVGSDSTVVFQGTATDAEDGSLGATGVITWTSSLSGTLGIGAELWVTSLPTGIHRITMAISDSDGNIGTDTIMIFVGVSPIKVYLPIVLKQ